MASASPAAGGSSSSTRLGLPSPERERIGDDADAGERHRCAYKHRAKIAQSRQRNADDVVDERPEETLADLRIGPLGNVGDVREQAGVATYQGEPLRLHSHVSDLRTGDPHTRSFHRRPDPY